MKDVMKITEAVVAKAYSLIDQLPRSEEWETGRKIRTSANNLLYYAAEAVANEVESVVQYDWAYAKKDAYALMIMFQFSVKQKMLSADPKFVTDLKALQTEFSKQHKNSRKRADDYAKKDLDEWKEKYRLWKATGK